MILQDINDYSIYSTGMHYPRYYGKVATRYGSKVHFAYGAATLCGSGEGWNRHPHRRFQPESAIVTCERCLANQYNWQQQAWLIFMEAEH